jgi:1-acyl-sn-glycerol-3-phosphate acyltransferase
MRTSPFRLVWRLARGLWWFAATGVRVLRTVPRDGTVDYDLTHRYSTTLSVGWSRIFHLEHDIGNVDRLLSEQPCIYVSNHRSNLDVLTMCGIMPPRAIVIGKRELLGVPFLGKIFRLGGNVPINRKDPDEARTAMKLAEGRLRDEGLSIFVFPEGHRNFGTLLPFKKGAFHLARNTGVRILPLVCAYPPRWMDGSRLWLAPEVDVIIDVLDPIDPSRFDSVESLIGFTRDRMAVALARIEAEIGSN